MKKDYNSRQRKIYKDYNVYSTENLLEILKNGKEYIPEVINVINDILSERNAVYPNAAQGILNINEYNNDWTSRNEEEASLIDERNKDEETVKSFADKLKDKTGVELKEIITRYTGYQHETVKAALIVSVDKGLISYDLKENLLKQIVTNFASHTKQLKQNSWETNNAFKEYVSGYQDDEIYNFIEDPKGMVIDVYHAVLLIAKERELISAAEFDKYFKEAKAALRRDMELRIDEIKEYFSDPDPLSDPENEAALVKETEKFWKCPSCNEMVDMELGVCWNCQTEMPSMVKHPDKEEVIKDRAIERKVSPFKTGFILIGGGIFVTVLSYFRYHTLNLVPFYYSPRFLTGIIFILVGFGFIIFGLFFQSKAEN